MEGRTTKRPRRFRRTPTERFGEHDVPVATRPVLRLLGLAFLPPAAAPQGLLIPRCRAVHTLGMRFPLDVVFLDRRFRVLCVRRSLERGRFAFERRASAVLELPAHEVGS